MKSRLDIEVPYPCSSPFHLKVMQILKCRKHLYNVFLPSVASSEALKMVLSVLSHLDQCQGIINALIMFKIYFSTFSSTVRLCQG